MLFQYALFGEGYAMYGEVSGYSSGLYGPIDMPTRKVVYVPGGVNNPDSRSIIPGISSASRIAARLQISARMAYPKYATSFPKTCRLFIEQIGINDGGVHSYIRRYYRGPFQQATYAMGLMETLQVTNKIKETVGETNFDSGKYNMWRALNNTLTGAAHQTTVEKLTSEGYFTKS